MKNKNPLGPKVWFQSERQSCKRIVRSFLTYDSTQSLFNSAYQGENTMIKKLVVGTLVTLAISAVLYAANLTGHAELVQIDQSGIEARIFFVDSGTHLFALGSASGLTPGH